MRPRSLARRLALQYLFMFDLRDGAGVESMESFVAEHCGIEPAAEFAIHLVAETLACRDEIDVMIDKFADNWRVERIAVVERNVLRLGVRELMLAETPEKVVLDETVRLAKRFGSKDSGAFINGVLDRIRRTLCRNA